MAHRQEAEAVRDAHRVEDDQEQTAKKIPEVRAVRSIESSIFSDLTLLQKLQQRRNHKPGPSAASLPCAANDLEQFSYRLGPSSLTTAVTICEEALSLMQAIYTSCYFTTNEWMRFANDTLFPAHLDARQSNIEQYEVLYANLNDPGHITSSIEVAIDMFDQGEVERAGSLLESACAGMKALVIEQHPQLLSCLPKALSVVCTKRYSQVNQVVFRHLHDVAHLILGESHRLVPLSSRLARAILENGDLADQTL